MRIGGRTRIHARWIDYRAAMTWPATWRWSAVAVIAECLVMTAVVINTGVGWHAVPVFVALAIVGTIGPAARRLAVARHWSDGRRAEAADH